MFGLSSSLQTGEASAAVPGTVNGAPRTHAKTATTVYFGGDIITMEGDKPAYVRALAVRDGKIAYAGGKDEALRLAGDDAVLRDLQGRTLLPGFIDSGSRFTLAAQESAHADLAFFGANPPGDVAGVIAKLKENQRARSIGAGEWIVGFGCDETFLKDGLAPDAADLDRAFPSNPVLVAHLSGLKGTVNGAALKRLGIPSVPESPPGLLRGFAYFTAFAQAARSPNAGQPSSGLAKAQQIYLRSGFTTVQDRNSSAATIEFLRLADAQRELIVDVVVLPALDVAHALLETDSVPFGAYRGKLKLGGVVAAADGAPQERLALFTQPYLTQAHGQPVDYCGFASSTQAELDAAAGFAYENGIQYVGYANGDGAIDMQLEAIAKAAAASNDPERNRRTVIAHSLFVRQDQLDAYRKLHVLPSLLSNHAYMFGDAYLKLAGRERAFGLSPMRSAFARELAVTNHTDYPATPPGALFAVWSAVNRISRSGAAIGPHERVSPYQALEAMTSNAAYAYAEENVKGTLRAGKAADLVILERNPLMSDPRTIKDIKVEETIKDGVTVFKL